MWKYTFLFISFLHYAPSVLAMQSPMDITQFNADYLSEDRTPLTGIALLRRAQEKHFPTNTEIQSNKAISPKTIIIASLLVMGAVYLFHKFYAWRKKSSSDQLSPKSTESKRI